MTANTEQIVEQNETANGSIVRAMMKKVNSQDEDAFFVVDLDEIRKSIELWRRRLPNVIPHYAVKCNNNLEILKLLVSMNVNFDCASKNEIGMMLNLGVDASRIVYANPCKSTSYIKYAYEQGIRLTTVDNVNELYKLHQYAPDMGVLIRIVTDDESAQCRLSTKFGCDIASAQQILKVSKELQLDIKGVAFHVGSGSKDFDAIHTAIKDSRFIFDMAMELGFSPKILDIGGGFQSSNFNDSSSMVNYTMGKFFPPSFTEEFGIRFIAEPGRFVVSNAFTLCCNVIAKRDVGQNAMLYINDGVYGNLNCIIYDHQVVIPEVLSPVQTAQDFEYSVWGPTCDGLDCITKSIKFCSSINIGDWLYFRNVGAYTLSATTSFNGFNNDNEIIYLNR